MDRVWHTCRVGGSPAHAVIGNGSAIVPDDLAANYHRVGGEPAHPTIYMPGGGTSGIWVCRLTLSMFQPLIAAIA